MYTQPTALRSVLDAKYLEYCLSNQYDIGPWNECVYWLRGLNDTYRVRTPQGVYILRVYRREVGEGDAAYEMSLLTQLQAILDSKYTNVAEPIAQKDNSYYSVIDAPEGQRIAAIFRYIEGTENGLVDEASCFAFGRSAAELHAAMDRTTLDQPRYELDTRFLIDQPLERILNYIGEDHKEAPFLRQFAGVLKERIAAAASQGLDWGICHGDMHGNNNALEVNDQFIHFDFEWAARGWRAYDLAQVSARKRQQEEHKEKLWNALLSGYRSVRAFSEQDEAAVELFVIARRWWVMGLDVAFIHNDTGALDFTEDWLNGFVEEFRDTGMIS